jgi:hypothetical protein
MNSVRRFNREILSTTSDGPFSEEIDRPLLKEFHDFGTKEMTLAVGVRQTRPNFQNLGG